MIKLIENEEKSFHTLAELKDHLASRTRKAYSVQLKDLALDVSPNDKEAILHSDRFEGRLAASGCKGLLNLCEIPDRFAGKCPPDLLCVNVEAMAKINNKPVRVELVDGIINTIMPSKNTPISNEVLVNWLADRQIKDATINGSYLRITSVSKEPKELLPNDEFAFGWELTNDEDGWRQLQAQQYVVRLLCSNGQLGFDKTASFSRSPGSHENVATSLQKLGALLNNMPEVERLAEAVTWANEQHIGDQRDRVVKYLTQRLDGRATRQILDDIEPDSTWYTLLNTLTSSAQPYHLAMQRRYEREGGRMLNWFRSQGRGRAPWRGNSCEQCEYLLANESEN